MTKDHDQKRLARLSDSVGRARAAARDLDHPIPLSCRWVVVALKRPHYYARNWLLS